MIISNKNDYKNDGFAICDKPIIPKELLDQANEQLYKILKGENKAGIVMDIENDLQLHRLSRLHVVNNAFRKLLTHTRIGEIAAKLTGAKKVKVWGTQLYAKPPGSLANGHVGWHRDAQHMPCFEGNLIVAWMALEEVVKEAGCLKYIKGSHLQNSYAMPQGAGFQDIDLEAQRLASTKDDQAWEEIDVVLPKGGVSFHHWQLIHGSGSNLTNQPRLGWSIGMVADEVRFLDNTPDYGLRDMIDNDLFCPVIYDAHMEPTKTN